MMHNEPIKVLVVEDSAAARMLLVHILRSDPMIQVVGAVENGRQAIQFLTDASVALVVMDIEMPEMDGLEATRRIMESRPVPIVICSAGANPRQTLTTFRSMEAGALACVEKPVGMEHKDFRKTAASLIEAVKLMSEVKVVRRWPASRREPARLASAPLNRCRSSAIKLIGIGASTGGPPALQTILAGLTGDFPLPLLVVQHISPGFLPGLVQWFRQTTNLKIEIAAHDSLPQPGHVYLAPDEHHMTVAADGRIALTKDEPQTGPRPSVARLFDSMAEVCGADAVGVLLTGMGKDGARELGRMKSRGAFTIAQDRQTSVVHGMPGEAIALDAAKCVLPVGEIASTLLRLAEQSFLSGENHEYIGSNA
jgi:two-component system, chemotaxis family, protein-glutamate methylesterase/glutaminase